MGFSLSGFLGTEVLGDAQLVIQTVLYFGIVLFGMMTAIPVGVTSVRITEINCYCCLKQLEPLNS